ncbi:mCG59835, isoform CRA_a, partial [Mus musculus]
LVNHSLQFLLKQVCPASACLQELRDTLALYGRAKTKVRSRSSSNGEDSISSARAVINEAKDSSHKLSLNLHTRAYI